MVGEHRSAWLVGPQEKSVVYLGLLVQLTDLGVCGWVNSHAVRIGAGVSDVPILNCNGFTYTYRKSRETTSFWFLRKVKSERMLRDASTTVFRLELVNRATGFKISELGLAYNLSADREHWFPTCQRTPLYWDDFSEILHLLLNLWNSNIIVPRLPFLGIGPSSSSIISR